MRWIYDQVTATGDQLDEDGHVMTEVLDLWHRDPVECIYELIGNPAFQEIMAYAPERVFADKEMLKRVIDEMWTADWWWEIQEELPAGATVASVILASDKTKLSLFRGNQVAWPVYLSIGNISKETCRQVSARATILVGYVPASKLECFTEANRSLAGYHLFHHCMEKILHPLIDAGTEGVDMVCADGCVRKVFPILAAYVADHPEQCFVVNVKENFCLKGTVDPDEREEPSECLLRNVEKTIEALDLHCKGHTPELFEKIGMRPVYEPFWRDLPHCDIFSCITPDVLHQLHKGVFKDHLMSWCASIVGAEELDRRFKAIPSLPGLRHFKNGISHVSQWTGTEHKEMQKVIVVLLAGAVDPVILKVVQAVVDFIYYTQFQRHTSDTLEAMTNALQTFHDHKEIFVNLGIHEHFNMPKLHLMVHYYEGILRKGTLDGFNTELPERLHIEYAKDAYCAGNRQDYIAHMITWLRWQEAIDEHSAFLEWLAATELKETAKEVADGSGADEPDYACAYKIAKRPAWPHTPSLQILTAHDASEFLPAFTYFIHEHFPASPVRVDGVRAFRLYKQIKIQRAPNAYVSSKSRFDRIRTTPAIAAHGRKGSIPAFFDTALVIEDPVTWAHRVKGSLQGLRAARVKVIFELPLEFGRLPHPLAYIEWYTPFTRIDALTGMYQIARSTRARQPNAMIVSVDRIAGPCHLIAKCGQEIDASWTSANVLDRATTFFVNPYITIASFASGGFYNDFEPV
ncbi:hypothetical protein NM688_g9270 [Phlebia brevispora]|uniref:Uncharacterized protein n=1 Tax=Phlebia brevispora TaxID=194682 RepID=A0ACC1RIS0_9APHY|nr:hypothetical protein NM688_g9270 [Phlebia brevispora]